MWMHAAMSLHDLKPLDPAGYAPCTECGMFTHPDFKVPHECPEPLPPEIARMLALAVSGPGAPPIHPRLYAQIRLGLRGGPGA